MISPKNEQILNILRQNCKISTREISNRLKIPITTIHNRIKKMEAEGVIKAYVAVVDHKKLGKHIQAFIQISVSYNSPSGKPLSQQELAERLYQMAEVDQCYIMTGTTDILVHVLVKDVDELNNFVTAKLRKTEGVENTLTAIVLSDTSEKMRAKMPFTVN